MEEMNKFIPVACPKASFDKYRDVILSRVNQVMESGCYILGTEVSLFEERFARHCYTDYCVGVGNGTMALALALKALGISPGDEIITVSHTSVATVAAIEMIGAVPVFVDVEEDSLNMDPDKIRDVVSPKTRAIIPVHLYGCPCKIQTICDIALELDLKVVEDCCQAHDASYNGQRVGSFGDAGVFSFYPTKNLGALGDAGAVVTKNRETFERLLALRQYGWNEPQNSLFPGWNSRMDEIQAAVLNAKLTYLNEDTVRRREIASRYLGSFDHNKLIPQVGDKFAEPVWHLFVLRSCSRDKVIDFMVSRNIKTSIHYPKPVHLQLGYLKRIRGCDNLPNTEKISKQIFTIPLYPELLDSEVDQICASLKSFAGCPNLSWPTVRRMKEIRLYIGEVPLIPEYGGLVGMCFPEPSSSINIHHDVNDKIPLPDNSVCSLQSEDVFEHIPFDKLIPILNEIYRVLRPGGLFRLSVPDYGGNIYRRRSVKDKDGGILFDPLGGVSEDGVPGHKWFPRYDTISYLINNSNFRDSKIKFLNYYSMNGTAVVEPIDYSKGHISRTPDFDERVKKPYRPLSIVVDIIK